MRKYSAKLLGVFFVLLLSANLSFGGCENDLMFALSLENPNQAWIAEPLDFSKPFKMNRILNTYVIDRGVNFYRNDQGNYELSEVRMLQVFCSPGLVGGTYFGGNNPGYMDLTSANPHKHLNWGVSSPGTYFFEFKLVNAKDIYGNPLKDSPVFLMVFIAGVDYANVNLKTAHKLPDTSKVQVSDIVINASNCFDGFMYGQTANRSAGVRIHNANQFPIGSLIGIRGSMGTIGGERFIQVEQLVSSTQSTAPEPLTMISKSVGGFGELLNTPSSLNAYGLRTTGLLINVSGNIKYDDNNNAYVDDGSFNDGLGLRIATDGLVNTIDLPTSGFITITGISGVDSELKPVIRPRFQTDIIVH